MGTSPNPPLASGLRYRFGVYEADLRSGELLRDGSRIKLQEQPFQVLIVLLERAGEVVTREELRQRLWPSDTFVDFDHSLNTAINKLREALRDSASNPRFIETKAKRGYRFIAPVQVLATAAPLAPEPSVTNGATPQPAPTAVHNHILDIPRPHPVRTRTLIALIQVMYLSFYIAALANLRDLTLICDRFSAGHGDIIAIVALVTAAIGIPMRLYLLTAVIFDYRKTGTKFHRIFPALFLLDELWAVSPFLLVDYIGVGLGFAATAALLYVPFSLRTLVRLTYPYE